MILRKVHFASCDELRKPRLVVILRTSGHDVYNPIACYLEGKQHVWGPYGGMATAGSHRRQSIRPPAASVTPESRCPLIAPHSLDDVENRELQLLDSLPTHLARGGIAFDNSGSGQFLARESDRHSGDEETIDLFAVRGENDF
jgi:hypothetical protein